MRRSIRLLGSAAPLAFACACSGGGGGGDSGSNGGDTTIQGITFDWSTYQELAPGSDNWPLTWCEDDRQYTSWGDGGGFGGTNSDGRVSLGFGRVTGPYDSFEMLNLWGGVDSVAEATFGGKVISLWCLDGDLYAWLSPGSDDSNFEWSQLIRSQDKGESWQEDAFPESRVDGCDGCPGLPYTLQYGRNYSANTDGYVYTYWIEIQDEDEWDVQTPGLIFLTRAPVAGLAFADAASWQWVTGFEASGNPRWGAPGQRVPVIEDDDGVMRGSALFVPGLARYLMVTNHSARNQGNLRIWEAPQPWGPWSVVFDVSGWPADDPAAPVEPRFSFGSFSPKWFRSCGHSGVFVWFGPDQWNSVAFELDLGP